MLLLFHETLLWIYNWIFQKGKKVYYLTEDMFASYLLNDWQTRIAVSFIFIKIM